jgi:predicted dinucleotide-binding enzyme
MIIGFLGAGHMAQTLARVWLGAGHEVRLANSRGPATLTTLIGELGPGATAITPAELVDADVVVLATQWAQTPAALAALNGTASGTASGSASGGSAGEAGDGRSPLAGKIVVDTTNNRTGPGPEGLVDLGGRGSSEVVADLLPGARLVKAFNHLPIPSLGTLREHPEPLALFYAGDDAEAKSVVAGLIRDLGGAPVDTGGLVDGGRLQGTGGGPLAGHGRPLTMAEAGEILAGIRHG